MRGQMKAILWILVIAFLGTIVFSWGMGGFKDSGTRSGIIGKVNKTDIKYETYENLVRRKQQEKSDKGEKEQTDLEARQVRDDVWNEYVDNLLKLDLAKSLDIRVSDEEIAYIIQNYPPKEVQEAESFQRDGKFDITLYQNFLREPQATEFLIGMEQSVRDYLTEQKLNFHLASATTVTPEEVRDEYNRGTARGKAKFIAIQFDKVTVDSAEITEVMEKKYYQMFADQYKDFAKRRFAYVKFKIEPSKQDIAEVQKEANNLIKELKDGADFAVLAKEYSADPGSGANGGDLGWFTPGAMVKPFEEAAFSANFGDIVGPVESKFGYHIIQVQDRKGKGDVIDSCKARHILLKLEASADTREDVYQQAQNFAQDAEERGFDQILQETNMTADTTKTFTEAGYVTPLGNLKMATAFCFNNPVGTLSGVYSVPDGYVVFKIVEVIPEVVKPFSEVQKRVRRDLERVIKKNKALDRIAELRAKMDNLNDLEVVALQNNLRVYETADSAGVTQTMPGGLRTDAVFMTELFRLNDEKLSGVIVGTAGAYIAGMVYVSGFNEDDFKATQSVIYTSLVGKKQDDMLKGWQRTYKGHAIIVDDRYKIYRDF